MFASLVFSVIPGQPAGLNPESRDCPLEIPGSRLRTPRNDGVDYPNTVFPLLITATLRAFTFASNEITLPSFHMSIVTVSPG
jgi:hypothetical protein